MARELRTGRYRQRRVPGRRWQPTVESELAAGGYDGVGEERPVAPWWPPVQLDALEDLWDELPAEPGVYLIRRRAPVARVGGADPCGTIYIGKSRRLRNRLWQFWNFNHNASGLLWENLPIATMVLGESCGSTDAVEKALDRLEARFASPIETGELERRERALLFAYLRAYGEMPPLNFSLPGRWTDSPGSDLVRWAEQGLSPDD